MYMSLEREEGREYLRDNPRLEPKKAAEHPRKAGGCISRSQSEHDSGAKK